MTGVAEVSDRPLAAPADPSSSRAAAGRSGSAGVAAVLAGLSPGRRAMKPLIVVAICVALAAAFLAWRSRPVVSTVAPEVSIAASPVLPTQAAPMPANGAPVSPADGASSPSAYLVVAIQGQVRRPGLVKLPPGARIADAIEAAGGVLPGTDVSYVNLAQKVADGQLIVINKSGPAGGSGGSAGDPGASGGSQLIDLNTASESDLETLPGIGPSLAARILAYRTQHGGFKSVDELRNVSGIGDSKFAELKDLVTV